MQDIMDDLGNQLEWIEKPVRFTSHSEAYSYLHKARSLAIHASTRAIMAEKENKLLRAKLYEIKHALIGL